MDIIRQLKNIFKYTLVRKTLFMYKNNKGFTLVELLVVISIIGILSSLAVVSLNSARVKARDALRKGDMAQLRTALEFYYDDNERYPICDLWDTDESDFGADNDLGADCYNVEMTAALASGTRPVMTLVPKDPKNISNLNIANGGGHDNLIYRYTSNSDGSQYVVVYRLEEDTDDLIIRGY